MPASLSFFQGDHPPHIGATVLDWISWPFWFSATNHRHHKKTPLLISITSFVKIISLYPDPRAGGLAGSLASVVLGSWPGPRFCFSFFPKPGYKLSCRRGLVTCSILSLAGWTLVLLSSNLQIILALYIGEL